MAWSLPDRGVLGIFAKRPDPGLVKTRIAAELGIELAAKISEAMTLDLADLWGSESILAPGGRRVLVFTPEDAGPWFDERVPEGLALQAQVEGDLGVRMAEFFAGEFADGASRVVVIGSDSPTLDPSIVISAFLCLESRDVVLGPATDGGFYLVGCRNEAATLFDGVEWGKSTVLQQTVERAKALGLSIGLLPPWYDVDHSQDLQVVRGHLIAMRAAGIAPWLPRLEGLLRQL